ncbi:MAG TPA: DNA polymerase III subunit delta [Chitinophagaceae bacterium]|nr:DNA polymerase III subunit delta [Chitinophagaceae bacterium]
MKSEKIIEDFKKKNFKPVYWLEGDEEFFIDEVMEYAENNLLTEAEAGFNLTIFYGRDASWPDVMNACRRYPMFAEKQVVLIKEAQGMKDIDKLESYIDKPLSSTILVVSYKNKKVDGRTKLAKLLKEKGGLLTTKKLYDSELPEWTQSLAKNKGYTLNGKALALLIDHIGNDLSRINNELDKVAINLNKRKNITEDDIEKFVGISKEFNVFELQQAIAGKDLYKAIRIVNYFEANPKAAPLPLVFPSLYNYFSKVLLITAVPANDEKSLAASVGISPYFIRDYIQTANKYSPKGLEQILLLLHAYNLKSIGVHDAGTEDMLLLKEMVVKMIHTES